MKNVTRALTIAILLLTFSVSAQSTVSNVLNLRSASQTGEIIENNKIVGYYIFYFKEKADKTQSSYETELFDDNYNSLRKFEITRPKNTTMMEMVFNGEVFMLHFSDKKSGYEFVTFDRTGTKLGSTLIPEKEISMWEKSRANQSLTTQSENVTIFPTSFGFIRQTFVKNKKVGYQIVAYNNNAEVIWTSESPAESELHEFADINDVTDEVIVLNVMKKKGSLSKELEVFCILLDSKTGKKIAERPLGNHDEGVMSLLKAFVDPAERKVTLTGEFYKRGDDIYKHQSEGIYLLEVSTAGEEIAFQKYNWNDFEKLKTSKPTTDNQEKRDSDIPYSIFFHDVIRTGDGHVLLIGEQFKKHVSGSAVAGAVLGSGGSMVDIRIGDMVVIEFDEKKKIVGFDLVDKRRTDVTLPAAGLYSSAMLGYLTKHYGGFDYSFTSRDAAADKYSIVYVDANRKENENSQNSDIMIGMINIVEGKVSTERIPLNITASYWWLQPAKPGNIAIGEYYRSANEVKFRLEQLTY